MIVVKTNKAPWKTSLIWAIMISIPLCIVMIIGPELVGSGPMAITLYFLGSALYTLWSYITGYYWENFVAIATWVGCPANFLLIWLTIYVIMRIRRRRRHEKVMQT
jgi:hypothetical protein